MSYLKFSLQHLSRADYELLIAEIEDTPFNGIEEQDDAIVIYYAVSDWQEQWLNILKKYSPDIHIEQLENENWNASWESQFEPVFVDDFVYIRAPFHPEVESVSHTILVSPKMSFGTGHHDTTWQMISMMRGIDFNNKRVFDFGTGTGILAILAEKLGAGYILANDNDTWSISNARENCENNSCSKVSITPSDIEAIDEKFDIILANINRHILMNYFSKMKTLLNEHGYIIISGVFYDDVKMLEEEAGKYGLTLTQQTVRNNWACIVFK